jgi:cytochrome c oxidase assembly factor CtaG
VRRAAVVLLAWAAWLGVLTAVQGPFAATIKGPFGFHPIEVVMLGGAAAACLVAGLVLWALDTRPGADREAPRLVSDSSPATAALIVGLALALLGAGFGLWLILIGTGVAALGFGGLVRETRQRQKIRVGRGAG